MKGCMLCAEKCIQKMALLFSCNVKNCQNILFIRVIVSPFKKTKDNFWCMSIVGGINGLGIPLKLKLFRLKKNACIIVFHSVSPLKGKATPTHPTPKLHDK